MKLKHIDNSFFELTAAQAKSLTVDGELPRHGYEKKVLNFAGIELLYWHAGKWRATEGAQPKDANPVAWVQRTIVNQKQVWAIRFHFSPHCG